VACHALRLSLNLRPTRILGRVNWTFWGVFMTYIITEPCLETKDGSCVEVCPVDCIYEGEDQFYIHPDECIDCGACEPECPVQAIFPDTDVPPEWTSYIDKNKVHFG
jgi:ferredoxin